MSLQTPVYTPIQLSGGAPGALLGRPFTPSAAGGPGTTEVMLSLATET